MAINFTTTGQAARLHGVKALVYGRAGVGKTVLCSTAPRPIILSAEAGLLSLAGHDIPVAEIKTVNDLSSMYQWATESKEAGNFDTICLDSISEIGEVVLNNAKKLCKDPRQAYGELIEKMTDLIRAFRDLSGKHVYFSAKQEFIKDDVTGVTSYGPSMPGNKLQQQLPYFFDEVFCLDIGKNVNTDGTSSLYRFLRTAPDLQYQAKDRSGQLDAMEMPSLGHIFNKVLSASPPALADQPSQG